MPLRGGGSAGGGKAKSNVAFNKPQEASFISKIKAQVGYKEPEMDLEAKRPTNPANFDDDEDERDDDAPTVVVLKDGDLTAEQAEAEKQKVEKDKEEKIPEDGKIQFKKPEKRKGDDGESEEKSDKKAKKKKKEKVKASLLSFDEEEDT